MKVRLLLFVAYAATGLAHVATADTIINITGSTAFRSAAVHTIRNSFTSVNYAYTVDNPSLGFFENATHHLFIGNFPGIPGTTIVRTFWSGSSEGARQVVQEWNTPSRFLDPANTPVSTNGTPINTQFGGPNLTNGIAKMFFTDVGIENTVYAADPDAWSLQPTDSRVGAIVYTFVKNEMAASNPKFAGYSALTNITSQQFRALFNSTFGGRILLSQFTGTNADDDTFVYATGRNDHSGTRTVHMLETGYGPTNLVAQWKVNSVSGDNTTSIRYWPTGDIIGINDNRSTQWNADLAGNGGYADGRFLSYVMGRKSDNVTLLDHTGTTIATNQNIIMLSYLGAYDARSAITNGAVPLKYNGVGISLAVPLPAAEKAKILNGTYTLWSWERFYRLSDAKTTADERTFFNWIFSSIGGYIGHAGLSMTEMTGVDRSTDGATVLITPP